MWSAYLKGTKENPIVSEERDWLLANRHSSPAEYFKDTEKAFYLFVETHPNPVGAIDCSEVVMIDGELVAEYSPEQLVELIETHTGASAIHVTSGQAQEVHKLLYTPSED